MYNQIMIIKTSVPIKRKVVYFKQLSQEIENGVSHLSTETFFFCFFFCCFFKLAHIAHRISGNRKRS